ncbi:MAG: CinA family protein [Methylomonas sp.]
MMEKIKTLLIENRLTIAAAESLTCGHLQAALGSVSGSSAYFEGGVTAYNFTQKTALLHVDPLHARSVNCVSQQVAYEMAEQACMLFGADLALAATGYAEPNPEHRIDAPLAYIAICRRRSGKTARIYGERIIGADLDRIAMQQYVTACALQALLDYLQRAYER